VVERLKIIFFAPTYEQKYGSQVTKVPELSTTVVLLEPSKGIYLSAIDVSELNVGDPGVPGLSAEWRIPGLV